MKNKVFIVLLGIIFFLVSCQKANEETIPEVTPDPTETIEITFVGTGDRVVKEGDSLDLLEGVSAKDQFGETYSITVIESIDYETVDRYEVVYQVYADSKIFTDEIYVDVVLNEERSELYRTELEQKLSMIQNRMDQEPFRMTQTIYDPSNDENYFYISRSEYQYFDTQTITTVFQNPLISNQSETDYITFMIDGNWYTYRMEHTYLFSPIETDQPIPHQLLGSRTPYFEGYIQKKDETYQIQTMLSDLSTYKDEKHLLGLIYNTYIYNLSQKTVDVTIEINVDDSKVDIRVWYEDLSSSFIYYATFSYDFEVEDIIDLDTLAHVDAKLITDVTLALKENVSYHVDFSTMSTRYYKISVLKDRYYEISGQSIHSFYFFDEFFEPLSLNRVELALFSGTRFYFKAAYDGDIFIESRKNSMPFTDVFDFMFVALENEPTMTNVTLTDDLSSYQVTASITHGIELIIPVKMNTYYQLVMNNDHGNYYFKEGNNLQYVDDDLFVYNRLESFITIYIFDDLEISWVEGNPL